MCCLHSCDQSLNFREKVRDCQHTIHICWYVLFLFCYINPCVNKWLINLDGQLWANENEIANGSLCESACVSLICDWWPKVYKRHSLSTDEQRHQKQRANNWKGIYYVRVERERERVDAKIRQFTLINGGLRDGCLPSARRTNDWKSEWETASSNMYLFTYTQNVRAIIKTLFMCVQKYIHSIRKRRNLSVFPLCENIFWNSHGDTSVSFLLFCTHTQTQTHIEPMHETNAVLLLYSPILRATATNWCDLSE